MKLSIKPEFDPWEMIPKALELSPRVSSSRIWQKISKLCKKTQYIGFWRVLHRSSGLASPLERWATFTSSARMIASLQVYRVARSNKKIESTVIVVVYV